MDTTLAHLAGAIDSDGSIGIRKNTRNIRVVKDSTNPTFSERLSLKQVTPQIPQLLHETFGGRLYIDTPNKPNSKPLHVWQCTDTIAARACEQLLPFLRVKKRQAEICLELRHTKLSRYRQLSYWFAVENPNWPTMQLVGAREAARLLGYTNRAIVYQAARNGTLLAISASPVVGQELPRYPLPFLMAYAEYSKGSQLGRKRPPQLIAWRNRLHEDIRELNKVGVNGTPMYHKTGAFAPISVG